MNVQAMNEVHIRDYLRVLSRHRWIAVSCFAVCVLAVALYDFTTTPVYQATTRLVIEKENPNIVSFEDVMAVDATSTDYYQTQYKLITSRSVAREVIHRLKLEQSEEFFPRPSDNFLSNFKRSVLETVSGWKQSILSLLKRGEEEGVQGEGTSPDNALVSAFLGRVNVSPIRNSRLVDISFDATDPRLAADAANALAKAYIDHGLEVRLEAVRNAMEWLNSRISEERERVEKAEKALLDYKQAHNIITDFSSDVETITAEKLAQINQEVVQAESARVEAETRYKRAVHLEGSPVVSDSIPEVLKNALMQSIKEAEGELYKQISELSGKYGQKHPRMQALQSELASIQRRKSAEVQRIVSSLKNEYEVALARENSLKTALSKQKGEALQLNQNAIEYGVLKRDAESAREMYEVLIKRFKETTVAQDINTSNIRIIDRAEVPKTPIKPQTRRDLLLAVVIGLALGAGIAFFLEYLDNTIKIPDEIEQYLELPYLGLVPTVVAGMNGKSAKDTRTPEVELVTREAPKSSASEAYRGIRTRVLFSSPEQAPKVILVSSAGPKEGKTISAANLAVSMAEAGGRVIVVGCDMRRPRLHKVLGVKRDRGISNVLVGECTLKEAIQETAVPNLHVLSCGPVPPNPAELLGSETMQKLLDSLRKHYAHVIIDSPPTSAVTDAVVLAKAVDGVILVVRANQTGRELVRNGVTSFRSVNAHLLGGILNDVDMDRNAYYYQYYYSYGYYYGEDGDIKKRRERRKRTRPRGTNGSPDEPAGQEEMRD